MALIHEAVGTIVYDPKNELEKGKKVLLIPNIKIEENNFIEENYLESSKFRSSNFDGFTQDYVCVTRD